MYIFVITEDTADQTDNVIDLPGTLLIIPNMIFLAVVI